MSDLIIRAAHFARQSHAGQVRKYTGRPYIEHPARVAAMTTLLDGACPEMVAAAWLHDVVEDCGVELPTILVKFGHPVSALVESLTNPSKNMKNLNRASRKIIDRRHIAMASTDSRRIKMLDRIDNLREMAGADPDFKKLYVDESFALARVIGTADLSLDAELRSECDRLLCSL